jgi:hypothetical protein
VTLDSLPLFVRAGGFIFRQPIVQNTGEMPGKPLQVLIAPAPESESSLYEDDGESLDYRQGNFMKRRFHQTSNDQLMTIDVDAPEGTYRPAARDLELETWAGQKPQSVSVRLGEDTGNGEVLPHLRPSALAGSQRGWSYADGMIRIKDHDQFGKIRFVIQY